MRHKFWLMPKARSARIMSNFSTLHASETGRVGDRDSDRGEMAEREGDRARAREMPPLAK